MHDVAPAGSSPASTNSVELLDKDETCKFFGGQARPINYATLYRGIKDGRYPAPIKVGVNSSRWIKSECRDALADIIARRDNERKTAA